MPGKVNKGSTAFIKSKQELDVVMKRFQKRVEKALAGIEGASRQGLRRAAEVVLARSQELVPRDTEALARSAFIETLNDKPEGNTPTGIGPTILIGYDRNNEAPHAVFVHEIIVRSSDGKFIHHKPPTQAKFLETAMKEKFKEIPKIVALEVENRMRRKARSK